ncbi:MAG: hypothetical protein DMF53_10845 [Acidobacteria bacterium]|nr:MAG: hypothetical protein DMF53_10845 [Acidobacteriota bacterium]
MDEPVSVTVTVTVAGRDRIFVEALTGWLGGRGDFRVVAPEALVAGVDVVLLDAGYRPEEALALAWSLDGRLAGAKMIVLGAEEERVPDFVEAGVRGCLPRGAAAADLAAVIHETHAGRTRCSPRLAAALIARLQELSWGREAPAGRVPEPLTPREIEILRLVAQGLSNKEVGRRLRIGFSTVKNHVHNILGKMTVHHRREAVRLAYECGLLGPGPGEGRG